MFRFNNPDALMTLLIVLAAYCTVRAIENGSTRWLVGAGLVMGFSFLAKGLQPFTVLPALGVAFLVCGPGGWGRRLLQLLGAGVGIVVGAGWWVLAVDLTPASSRPYIGGSGNNTALGLAFGYNGVSRITGGAGNGGGGGGGGSFSGSTGLGRLFNSLNGGQIAWLLPTALVAVVATAVVTRRVGRTDHLLASLVVWGGWVVVTGGLLSFASGTIHTYYTVELAPAIAAVVAIGAVTLWRARAQRAARVGLAVGALATGIWSYVLLDRASDWHPWVRWVVLLASIAAAITLLVPPSRARRGLVVLAAVIGIVFPRRRFGRLRPGRRRYPADRIDPVGGSVHRVGLRRRRTWRTGWRGPDRRLRRPHRHRRLPRQDGRHGRVPGRDGHRSTGGTGTAPTGTGTGTAPTRDDRSAPHRHHSRGPAASAVVRPRTPRSSPC